MNTDIARRSILPLIRRYASAIHHPSYPAMIPATLMGGKLYEAYVLALLIRELVRSEGLEVRLTSGTKVELKSSGGPINRKYPAFELYRGGMLVAELFTDVTFLTLSWRHRGCPTPLEKGDYHELDLVITDPGLSTGDRPEADQVWLAVECKNRDYEKSLLREILGVRRELSYLAPATLTHFRVWPATSVPADPPSCVAVVCSDAGVASYSAPGGTFGIQFRHVPI